jgi:hypothetical protein
MRRVRNFWTTLYFGDHIKSDIYALKHHTNWLAGVVIEELEFDTPPATHLHSSNRLSTNDSSYIKGNQSKYFSSFFYFTIEFDYIR